MRGGVRRIELCPALLDPYFDFCAFELWFAFVLRGDFAAQLAKSGNGLADGLEVAPSFRNQPRDGFFVFGNDDFLSARDPFRSWLKRVLAS